LTGKRKAIDDVGYGDVLPMIATHRKARMHKHPDALEVCKINPIHTILTNSS